jgi:hypothetical protein
MMNNPYLIQNFVTRTLQHFGALVEQNEYALVQVLLPDALVPKFQGKDTLWLAFDYEVSQENKDYDFITFGSQVLDVVTELALSRGKNIECFLLADRLDPPAKIESLIEDAVHFVKCRQPKLKSWFPIEHCYYCFNFHCTYYSDEKMDEIIPVLIDMNSGRQDKEIQELLPFIEETLPAFNRQHILPSAPMISINDAYLRACAGAEPRIKGTINNINSLAQPIKERELKKVAEYYQNLIYTLNRRLRNSQDANRIERLKKQIATTTEDQERRLEDINDKFTVEAEVSLDTLIRYRLPKLNLELGLQQKDELFQFQLLFNPLSRQVETPLCPQCGYPTKHLLRKKGLIHCGCQ